MSENILAGLFLSVVITTWSILAVISIVFLLVLATVTVIIEFIKELDFGFDGVKLTK